VITVSLMGGLGNQMFQYAAGKALAERHGVSLALDISGFRNSTHRSFLLDRLSIPEADRALAAEVGAEKPVNHFVRSLWKRRIDRVLESAGLPKLVRSANQYREPHFHYDSEFEALGSETSLFGYFQSERYFSSIAQPLRDWFSPRAPLGIRAAEVCTQIERNELSVSVHVRRGDYLNPATAKFHGVLGETYYRQAIDWIEAALGKKVVFFVFSDDPVLAERVLNFVPKCRLNHVRGDPHRPWEDLALMARCRHHVMANSSFSWWGAWLNPSPDKVVVAPRNWFAQNQLNKQNTSDLYPVDWILVGGGSSGCKCNS
jgi:Glycosyl transferase family 11